MNEQERYTEALGELQELLTGFRKDHDQPEVYSLDKRISHDLLVAGGGPTAFIRITTDSKGDVIEGTYHTNMPDYAKRSSHGMDVVRLSPTEAEEIADLFMLGYE
jgi:hypothetical protein